MANRAQKDLPQTPIGDAVAELAQAHDINLLRVRVVKRNAVVSRQRAQLARALVGRGYRWLDVADILHCEQSGLRRDLKRFPDDQPTPPTRKTPC